VPNTLAHIGINSILTKIVIKDSNLHWIYLGCILPDIPWIIRKLVLFPFPNINGYDLQSYVIVQASLFFSLILSLAFASFSQIFRKTFLILSIGSLFHLLLDSIQIKWANGVHFFAPINWELTSYNIFWPESFGTYFITLAGLVYFILNWKNPKLLSPDFDFSVKRVILGSTILLIYFILPIFFMSSVKNADNHFLNTLANIDTRVGKYVEMDRKAVAFNKETNSYWSESFNNELIELKGLKNIKSSALSIRGIFITNDLVEVEEFHENWAIFRDGASYIGLFLILLVWIKLLINRFVKGKLI